MSCERPISLKNPKGGTLQAICGTCRSCLIRDIKDWSIRLQNENKHCFNSFFVTLTYSDDFNDDELHPEHLQKFIKNLRNYIDYDKTALKINYSLVRYFGVGEYGEKFARPHYHVILFNLPYTERGKLISIIHKSWQKGFVQVDEVNKTTIEYVCKYIFKQKTHRHEKQRPFRLMSTRPAIGTHFLTTHQDYILEGQNFFYNESGRKFHLPRYYRDRILDDEFKEKYKDQAKEFSQGLAELDLMRPAEENVKNTIKRITALNQKTETFIKQQNKNNLR